MARLPFPDRSMVAQAGGKKQWNILPKSRPKNADFPLFFGIFPMQGILSQKFPPSFMKLFDIPLRQAV